MGNADLTEGAISPKGTSTREAQAAPGPLLVSNLGWHGEEVQETRGRLRPWKKTGTLRAWRPMTTYEPTPMPVLHL